MIDNDAENINPDDGSVLPGFLTPVEAAALLGKDIIFIGKQIEILNVDLAGIGCCNNTFINHITYKELAKRQVKTVDGIPLYKPN